MIVAASLWLEAGGCGGCSAMAAQMLLDKRAARGCDPKVLAKVRKEVFDVEAPKP